MAVNTAVVGGAVGIAAIGVVKSVATAQPISGVVIGAYGIALIGSILDLYPPAGKLAGSLVLLALLGAALDAAGVLGKGFAIFGAAGSSEPGQQPPRQSPPRQSPQQPGGRQ